MNWIVVGVCLLFWAVAATIAAKGLHLNGQKTQQTQTTQQGT